MARSMTKAQRTAILAAARVHANRGEHEDARRMFASVGISYVAVAELL